MASNSYQFNSEWRPEELTSFETIWVKSQPLLESKGYALRPRYRPGWTPSWVTDPSLDPLDCEDSLTFLRARVLDATRISDGAKVVLKLVYSMHEVQIMKQITSLMDGEHLSCHCTPLLDVISLPESTDPEEPTTVIVMPLLRNFSDPYFHCREEFFQALLQFLEGLRFLHAHNIAHRDACTYNMMMDASRVIPSGWHFCEPDTVDASLRKRVRAGPRCRVTPVHYYFIDFETSQHYPEGLDNALSVGLVGQIKDVPELSDSVPYSPFSLDIYQVGQSFLRLTEKYAGVEVFEPLLKTLTASDPKCRPSAGAAIEELKTFFFTLPWHERHARVWYSTKWGMRRAPNRYFRRLAGVFPRLRPFI